MPLYPFRDKRPVIAVDAFIAPNAVVIGDTEIGSGSNIWFNCVLRGDVNKIHIGTGTNVQDGTIVHVSRKTYPTFIGNHVTVGHKVLLHGCTLEDHAFIGMQATIMDNCVVETDGMVAAGALLTPGKRVKRGELWAGSPARFLRLRSTEEIEQFRATAPHYVALGAEYARTLATMDGASARDS